MIDVREEQLTPSLATESVVSAGEWGLGTANLVMALVAWLSPTREALATVVPVMALLSLLIVIISVSRALRSGHIGHAFLHFGVFVTYWMGFLRLCTSQPAFASGVFQIAASVGLLYPLEKVALAAVYVALFQFTALLGMSLGVPSTLRRMGRWRWDRPLSTPLLWVIALSAFAAWIPSLVAFRGDVEQAVARQMAMRSGSSPSGGFVGLLAHLTHFAQYGTAVGIVLIVVTYGRRSIVLWVGAFTGLVFFMLQGTRHHMLFVAVPVAVYVFRLMVQQRKRKLLALLVCGLLLIGLVYQLQTALRERGWREIGNIDPRDLIAFKGMDHIEAMIFSLVLVPEQHDYFHEAVTPYFVTHFVPHSWWPSKPFPKFWLYYNQRYTRGDPFNVCPSYIGQSHMTWGFMGVVIGALWMGWLTRLADTWFHLADAEGQKLWVIWVGSFYGFLISMHRIYYPLYFVYPAFAFIAMVFLTVPRPADVPAEP